jgi:hypothetical protein
MGSSNTFTAWSGITSVRAASGALYGIAGFAPDTCFIQIYDKASAPVLAPPTPDKPVMTLLVIGGQPFNFNFSDGVTINNGIQIATTRYAAPSVTTLSATALNATVRHGI